MADTRLISRAEAVHLATAVLAASRVSDANAAIVADALVAAEMDGLRSHGLLRLLAYADQAIAGKVDGFAVPAVSRPKASVLRIDARDGFAFPALAAAVENAAPLASECGIVALPVANSHHAGIAGHPVEALARRGLVALMFSNSPAAIAPWGGATASFGTNPIAFAAPTADEPLVVDLSVSEVARGKILVAAQKGESIPQGWALDREGHPTTNAKEALAGTMVPLGGAKGAALALMIEILTATLTGSNHAFEASSFLDDKGGPPRIAQLIVAIDPAPFGPDFAGRMEMLLTHAFGQEGTRRPGARRFELRRRHEEQGFPIEEELYSRIAAEPRRRGPTLRPGASAGSRR